MNKSLVSILAVPAFLGALALPASAAGPGSPVPRSPIAGADTNSAIVQVQSTDALVRVNQLEEQIRQLNGRIEELNFQLLEMQELLRRMQEDNQYRFQEIEDKLGSRSSTGDSNVAALPKEADSLGKAEPSGQTDQTASPDGTAENSAKRTIDGVEVYDGDAQVDERIESSLGTIQFDENGNIVETAIGKPLDLTRPSDGSGVEPAMPDNADELFTFGYDLVQTGHYEEAEQAFETFSERYPDHPKLPEVRFWLGESYLGRSQYEAAAKVYLDAHKNWPDSRYGPQTLLKLGVSVAGLNQRELACATYAEVIEKYPDASRMIQRNVVMEQRAAGCTVN